MSKLVTVEDYSKYIHFLPGGKGISMADNTPFPAWQEAVRVCGSIVADGMWALGDLFLGGEEQYGEESAQALEKMKYTAKSISNAIWVCKAFPPSRRHSTLTFNHHAVCAAIEDKELREEILQKAEKEEMSVREITELKKEKSPSKRKPKAKKPAQSPQDDAGEAAASEETEGTETRTIVLEEAQAALKELTAFLTQEGKGISSSSFRALETEMADLGRLGRRIGFFGGSRSGKKEKKA